MVLLAAPLLVARVVYTRYGMMRDVCDDTTLAVMEAVESASMFSEGHSVGVASMAAAIADEMDFQEEDLHLLRQAALLHDIGLLALDPALVGKPGPLTPEEYEEIKKHPLIGARIVSNEESLAVMAPAITHHHEMVDGSGYVDGLTGDTIPIGARILAVADAFDAMQRTDPVQGAARRPTRRHRDDQGEGHHVRPRRGRRFHKGRHRSRHLDRRAVRRGDGCPSTAGDSDLPGPRASVSLRLRTTASEGDAHRPAPSTGATPADGHGIRRSCEAR